VRLAAAGLATLHQSGVRVGDGVGWRDSFDEVARMLERLRGAVPASGLDEAISPLLQRLEKLGAEGPAEAAVPSHGSFAPEQVLIHRGRVAIIDFDGLCQAEPAMDVGQFVAAFPDLALKAVGGDPGGRDRLFDRADVLSEEFLAEYEQLAPVSRERVTLWRALHFTVEALRTWTKPKAVGGSGDLAILEHYVSLMG
jgi:aminoglycoside phosphotransferase (APT) family kinase protein